jgi:hypothetical protein
MGDVPSERTQADCDRCLLKECASLEDNCMVCRRAINLKATHPEEPELWRDFETTCTNLGDAACYEAPKSTLRTDLTFDEQAMESPSIDLSATQSQSLVLQFEFIAYDLKDTFIRVIQGRPESEWPKEKERVMVQFCAANCELSENWQNGSFAGTTEESFIPADTERRNGILYTQQNRADWTLHRRMVSIPQNMRTKDFRFRFVPVLSQGVRVGVDNIFIKEQK